MTNDKSKNLADLLFPDKEEENIDILNIPPNERKLNTETYDFTVSTIDDYIKDEHILIPKFQRGYVWNRSQASRLIESLIIQCPIPVVFLSQNSDETLSVIDGNQRLTSINLYLNDDFALKGLSAYPELEGFKFSDLDPRFKRHIKNRTIRCIVILKDTHPQIKFDVFERLNTGSVKLNPQELRHGLNTGPFMDLVDKMAKSKDWQKATATTKNKRMKSEELIIRFWALRGNWKNYLKPMTNFLNEFATQNRRLDDLGLDSLKSEFEETFELNKKLFGDFCFKTFDQNFKNAKFNMALFDAQMVSVYNLRTKLSKKKAFNQKDILEGVSKLFQSDKFRNSITAATTDKNAVIYRITEFSKFLKSI